MSASTTMICPVCGGVKVGAGGSVGGGRRCTCGATISVGAPSSAGGTSTAVGSKVCCVCKTDVTDKKRMKDSATGRYWCYECFVIEQRKKQSGVSMTCPHCKKSYPPLKMVKHGEVYWCESCQDEADAKRGKKKKPSGEPGTNGTPARGAAGGGEGSKVGTLVAVFVVLVLAAVVYLFVLS